MLKNDRKKEGIRKGLEDDEGEILLKNIKRILKPIQKKDVDNYLQRVRECDSPAIKNREIRRNKKLKKSVFQTRLIVDMFLAQQNKK